MNKTSKEINPAVWCTYMVLLMLPEMLMLNTKTWWDAPVSIAFNVLFYGVFTWILCALSSLTGKTIERFIHVVLQTVAAAYSISNVFMLVMFNRHWDAYSWQFLSETNGRESSEFFFSYILSLPTLLLLTTYIVLFVAEIVVGRRVARWRIFPSHILPAAGAIVLCAVMLGHTFFFGPDADTNYTLAAKYRSPIKRNAIWNIWQSALTYKSFRDEFARCARSLHNYKEKVTCSEREADVVLIVGESFNRHMSNLYDGKYDTNPRLKALAKQGKLFVFNDVVASDNGTRKISNSFFHLWQLATTLVGAMHPSSLSCCVAAATTWCSTATSMRAWRWTRSLMLRWDSSMLLISVLTSSTITTCALTAMTSSSSMLIARTEKR